MRVEIGKKEIVQAIKDYIESQTQMDAKNVAIHSTRYATADLVKDTGAL